MCDKVLHFYIDFAFKWVWKTLIIADLLETQPDQKQIRVAVTHLISSLLHVDWKWNYSQKYLPSLLCLGVYLKAGTCWKLIIVCMCVLDCVGGAILMIYNLSVLPMVISESLLGKNGSLSLVPFELFPPTQRNGNRNAGELLWRHPLSYSLVWFTALKIPLVSPPRRGWTPQGQAREEGKRRGE